MTNIDPNIPILLWTGPKHAGKTTAAQQLVQAAQAEGLHVAGFLALSRYQHKELQGFDLLDLSTTERFPLCEWSPEFINGIRFQFHPDTQELGQTILMSPATAQADLVVVDEFGSLEIKGQGWRKQIDQLLDHLKGSLLLIVRQSLLEDVQDLYQNYSPKILYALDTNASHEALTWILKNKRPPMTNEQLLQEIQKHTADNKIPCVQCFKLAEQHQVPLKTIGDLCNENNIRVKSCQLGCFM